MMNNNYHLLETSLRSRFFGVLVWSVILFFIYWSFGVSNASISALIEGYGAGEDLIKEMFPPRFSNLEEIFSLLGETIAMGVWATLIGMIFSLFFGIMSARNISPNKFTYFLFGEIVNIFRAIPDIVYALVFVVSVGVGALSGVLALIFATIGLLSKFYAEAFESVDMKPIEALKSTGSGYFSWIFHGLLPQSLPLINSYNLYLLDHNIRAAMVLGLVGAGGIGVELYTQVKYFNYDKVSAILIIVLVLLSIIDRVSLYLMDFIMRPDLGYSKIKKYFVVSVFTVLATVSIVFIPEDISSIISSLPKIYEQLVSSFPPDFTRFDEFLELMIETIAMAMAATVISIVISLPLGIVMSKNMGSNVFLRSAVSGFVNFCKAVPDLIFALIFVAILGLGPFAGVLAVGLHVTGFLAKFYAEAIDSVDFKPIESITSTGASRIGIFRHAIFPQILPLINSYNLYMLDRNVRTATTMGIVGAGGIGFELIMSIRLFEFTQTVTIVLMILVVVSAINRLSSYIRSKIV